MSHNFKPGDLALIINAQYAENLGKVVELLRFDNSEKIAIPEEGPRCYMPNPSLVDCWVVRGDLVGHSTLRGAITCVVGGCPQSCLMPLRGDFAPEQQKSREVAA